MTHTALIGIGSNLGDRQGNILQALQRLRARVRIDAVSSFYETQPVGNVAGPAFLNVAASLRTALEPPALERLFRDVEMTIGRHEHLSARAIDIDFLYYDDVTGDFGRFELPHPYIEQRAYNLIPLAEVAPDFVDPVRKRSLAELAKSGSHDGVVRKARTLHFDVDRQSEQPENPLSLNRVGVSGIKRIVRLDLGGTAVPFNAEFAMVADLAPDRAGVHMSRFSELLEEALLDVLSGTGDNAGTLEELVERVAREIVGSQKALRADVRVRAPFSLERWTPVSGKRGEETYTLVATAHADTERTRRVVGIEAEGMTACPCAQLMVREHSLRELVDAGFSEREANRALDALPVATHNQRGRGSVTIGTVPERAGDVRAEDLVEIVENSMSSETYDLLKRPDEFFVVNKAHFNPRFVEDVVRGILARALDVYGDFPDETFIAATQINYESIHKHDAFAEAYGTFGEFRRELRERTHVTEKTDLASWLGTRPSHVVA